MSQESPSGRPAADRAAVTLITGANGEFGHGLIRRLHEAGHRDLVAVDLRELDASLQPLCRASLVGDIVDPALIERLGSEFRLGRVYHLAALLSTRGERSPELAHQVNVDGTLQLLHLAAQHSVAGGEAVRFLFPSSIAVYGLPDLESKRSAGAIDESRFLEPITMYGCNKLACEHLGRYYRHHYRQLAADRSPHGVDFRSIRFPGVISAFTIPTGGTSDFAPEMIHAAARGESYACFVRQDARIPFITMPDAIDALLGLADADPGALRRCVYNVGSFNPSAGEIAQLVTESFPSASIRFEPHAARQGIVDSWPEDVDDAAARRDWNWQPKHDLRRAFAEYLIPHIRGHYARGKS